MSYFFGALNYNGHMNFAEVFATILIRTLMMNKIMDKINRMMGGIPFEINRKKKQ